MGSKVIIDMLVHFKCRMSDQLIQSGRSLSFSIFSQGIFLLLTAATTLRFCFGVPLAESIGRGSSSAQVIFVAKAPSAHLIDYSVS